MTILGIETATDVCGTAVVREGKTLAESVLREAHIHAAMLMHQIHDVLERSKLSLQQIDGIAVSIGPGSFTGLRIGLSAAKGLAWAVGKPLAAVPTLRAIARRALDEGAVGLRDFLLPVLKSRHDEVYCQLFQVSTAGLVSVWEERGVNVGQLCVELGEREVVVTGEGASKLCTFVEQQRIRVSGVRYLSGDIAQCSAAIVALEGEIELRRGNTVDPATAEPRYIKEFQPKVVLR